MNERELTPKNEQDFRNNSRWQGIRRHKKIEADSKVPLTIKNKIEPHHKHYCKIKVFCNRGIIE